MTTRPTIPLTCALYLCLPWGTGCSHPDQKRKSSDDISVVNMDIADTGTQENAVDLVHFDQWSILDDIQDPHPAHRTDAHVCNESGILPEDEVLEINTNDCGYALVGQPLQASIETGDVIELLMYHSALSAIEQPAEAHFSLMVGDRAFWDITIDIPWQSEVYLVPIEVDWSAGAGTLVRLHLHNHGGNSWRIAYLKRIRQR